MDLHQMECVVAVADHGSFTRAATALYRTQPSLSYAIGRLERELGTALFSRRGRRVELTAAGEAFLVEAREALRAAAAARQAATGTGGLVVGRLDVGVLRPLVAPAARLAGELRRAHPGITVALRAGEPDEIVEWVRSSVSTVGLARLDRLPADVAGHRLFDEELVAAFPPGTDVPEVVDVTAFVPCGLVAPHAGSPLRARFERALGRSGVPVAAEAEELEAILELVLAGAGAALVSASGTTGFAARGGVVRAFVPVQRYPSGLVHRRGRLTPVESAFRALALRSWPAVAAAVGS